MPSDDRTDTRFRFGRRNFIKAVSASALCSSFCPTLFAAAMTPSPRPKVLVLGGTAFGLGVAVANPGRCVVIERSLHLAPEFSQVGDWGELGEAATAASQAGTMAIDTPS